jgi:hypothetical protein
MGLLVEVTPFVFAGDELNFSAFGPISVLIRLASHLFAVLGSDNFGPGLHLGDFLVGWLADARLKRTSDENGAQGEGREPDRGHSSHPRHDKRRARRDKARVR